MQKPHALIKEKEDGTRFPAESIGPTEVVVWDRQIMVKLMLGYPQPAIDTLKIVIDRLDDVETHYLEISARQVEQRIARALLRIMGHSGRQTREGILINFPISRQGPADYTGTTFYTVRRILSVWSKKGWSKSGREHITVTDPQALVAFSETG
ncbi:MAG: Crp/Fnr family transcriptional regulator [Deltaproteobacteria bacterium]|nr:Crp/Fnr family transcriptional regulator [Deltaproteobacteria bacterium]